MSALERKGVPEEEEEVTPEVKEPTNLNSILDCDNAVEQVRFYGAVTEQTELKKLLGKRSRRPPKIEQLEIVKREVRPRTSTDFTSSALVAPDDNIRGKLMQAFMEACQMLDEPSP